MGSSKHTHDHDHDHGHGHSHHHHHHHHHHGTASETLLTALVLNGAFTLIELVGAWWTNSVAIGADAVHDLGDTIALAFAYGLQRFSQRKRDAQYSYGYGRFSLASAWVSGTALIAGTVLVLRETLPRLWEPREPYGQGMIALGVLGVLFNGAAVLRLGRGQTMNERIMKWHLLEDALGWIAVLVGALAIHFLGWTWLDAWMALAIALWVGWNAIRNLKSTFAVFLQAKPENLDLAALESQIRAVDGVRAVHDVHAWSLDGDSNVLSLHVVVAGTLPPSELSRLKSQIRAVVARHGSLHLTMEIEVEGEPCAENCDDA